MNSKVIKHFTLGICCLLSVYFAFWTGESYYAFDQAERNLQEEKRALAALKTDIEETKKLITRWEQDEKDFSKLLFSERDVPAFLDGISQSAQQASVKIVNMQTKSFKEVPVREEVTGFKRSLHPSGRVNSADQDAQNNQNIITLSAMPIQIKVEGAFAALLNFLNLLENYKQLLTISSVQIESGGDYPVLRCEFTLRIYSLKFLKELDI